MRYDISHIPGHHQARWFMAPEGAEFRQPIAARIGYWLHGLLRPDRHDKAGHSRIMPGQSIASVSRGYHASIRWRLCKDEVQ